MKISREFVASDTAKITFSSRRVRRYNTVYRSSRKGAIQLLLISLVPLALATLFVLLGWYIPAGIFGLILLLFLWIVIKGGSSMKEVKAAYNEGLLIPAIVRSINPLTILALAPLANNNSVMARHACREFKVEALPGHNIKKGERVPCASLYTMSHDNRNYFSSFSVYPLCCATESMEEVRRNTEDMHDQQDWDILANLSDELPDKDYDMLYILDEHFRPLIFRNHDLYSSAEYRLTLEDKELYQKRYDTLPDARADNPDAEMFQSLARKYQVAEYFLGFDGDKNKGYVTPMNNPAQASKDIAALAISFAAGEIPLATGKAVVTNKGVWNKKGFIPWKDTVATVNASGIHSDQMRTSFGKESLAYFTLCYDLYPVELQEQVGAVSILKALETERLSMFWRGVKSAFSLH